MGVVGRPHGIKGEISVDWHGEKKPEEGNEIYLQAGGDAPVPWRIASSRMHNGKLLLTLDGIHDRTAAEGLRAMKIFMPRSDLPEPEADEAYAQDLPGVDVFLADNEYLGRIDHIVYPGNQMVWAIIDDNNNEILFPAEPCFISSIDMKKRKAVIEPPPGLLEIYRA